LKNFYEVNSKHNLGRAYQVQVAERKGINNNPNPTQIVNLKALAINILQPVRSEFDSPLIISSGFRCAQLNIEIGSKLPANIVQINKSAAADFEIPGVDNKVLAQWIRDNLIWNQLILEFYKEGEPSSGWVHCSYSTDLNKKESLIAYREDGKVKYKPWS
jgi:zinc D-Ala-D-Ala carboxypeptidase